MRAFARTIVIAALTSTILIGVVAGATVAPANGTQSAPGVYNVWYKTGLLRVTDTTEGIGRNYFYDDNNNLSSEQFIVDGTLRTLSYAYNAEDNLTRLSYPSGTFVDFNPDVLRPAAHAPKIGRAHV